MRCENISISKNDFIITLYVQIRFSAYVRKHHFNETIKINISLCVERTMIFYGRTNRLNILNRSYSITRCNYIGAYYLEKKNQKN